jgi:hypothetical protein
MMMASWHPLVQTQLQGLMWAPLAELPRSVGRVWAICSPEVVAEGRQV